MSALRFSLSTTVPASSIVIGVAGPSCSGKSSLSRELAHIAPSPALVLSQDLFYRDLSNLPPSEREFQNFDHPDALDWDLFQRVVQSLSKGQPAVVPLYSFGEHRRLEETEVLQPAPLLIIEGVYALHDPQIRNLMRITVYVDIDESIALRRRIERDLQERGRTEASVRRQFEQCVRPMWRSEVERAKQWANLILNGSADLPSTASSILQLL